uniref:Uncharacterized protein n=1 Tax=Onchocerca volvulus TaxID=6282 RepID=A0A8R1TKR3_ONCVO
MDRFEQPQPPILRALLVMSLVRVFVCDLCYELVAFIYFRANLGRQGALMQPPVNSPLSSLTVTIFKFIPFSIHLILFTICSSVVISKKVHLFNLNDRFVIVVGGAIGKVPAIV